VDRYKRWRRQVRLRVFVGTDRSPDHYGRSRASCSEDPASGTTDPRRIAGRRRHGGADREHCHRSVAHRRGGDPQHTLDVLAASKSAGS